MFQVRGGGSRHLKILYLLRRKSSSIITATLRLAATVAIAIIITTNGIVKAPIVSKDDLLQNQEAVKIEIGNGIPNPQVTGNMINNGNRRGLLEGKS